jgi:hypothetical protein
MQNTSKIALWLAFLAVLGIVVWWAFPWLIKQFAALALAFGAFLTGLFLRKKRN